MISIDTLQAVDNGGGDSGCMTITLNRPVPYPAGEAASGPPVLDVVIPVYNEQDDLEPCVWQLPTPGAAELRQPGATAGQPGATGSGDHPPVNTSGQHISGAKDRG
jgi:hypothetical protein